MKTDHILERLYNKFCTITLDGNLSIKEQERQIKNQKIQKSRLQELAAAGLQGHPDQENLLTGILVAKGAFPVMCKLETVWGCYTIGIFAEAGIETQTAILAQSPENFDAAKTLFLFDPYCNTNILEPAINHLKANNPDILQSHYKALGLDQNGQKHPYPSPSILT